MDTRQLRELDQRHIWHPFTPMRLWLDDQPLVIVAAEGMHLIDSDGHRYLDGVASLWCNVHGHRVPEIDSAIRQQLDRVAHSTLLGLAGEASILLADRLMKLVPDSLAKVFFSDAGATATEAAFKMAVQYWHNLGQPQRTGFIALSEAYHGDTLGAVSIGRTERFHRAYLPLLFPVHYAPTPFVYRSDTPHDPDAVCQRSLEAVEKLLEQHARTVAAICVEPIVQGAAGMIVQPPGFLRGLAELARRFDVLLVCDEVATGFGRTGRMFACEHEAVKPDLLCVGKGLTGGYLPLAATFASQRIFDAFLGQPDEGRTFFHGHTYTGNPLACAAALASLELFESRDLLTAVTRRAAALAVMLDQLRPLPCVGDIRQKGLMVGIELVEDRATRRPFPSQRRIGAAICAALRNHGVILRPLGDVIVIMPPLAMPEQDLAHLVTALHTELTRL